MILNITAVKNYKEIALKRGEEGRSYRNFIPFNKDEGTKKNIFVYNKESCDCISCNYRNLDFKRIFKKLKESEDNDALLNKEYAFGNYLLSANTYKKTYSIYKKIEKELKGKEKKGVEYFLIKMNIKLLYNLCRDYDFADKEIIMSDIKSIDLDKVIYDEIEFDLDKEVKNYLLDVKKSDFIYLLKEEINKTLIEIESLKELYDRGGTQTGPDWLLNLGYQYHILYLHINSNFIVRDIFTD